MNTDWDLCACIYYQLHIIDWGWLILSAIKLYINLDNDSKWSFIILYFELTFPVCLEIEILYILVSVKPPPLIYKAQKLYKKLDWCHSCREIILNVALKTVLLSQVGSLVILGGYYFNVWNISDIYCFGNLFL